MAFQAGYAYPVGNVLTQALSIRAQSRRAGGRAQITMDGNQALAYGLIAAGVRFGAGYPITPWSSIMEILRRELPKYGGIFVQAEDELGAVSIALGFSYAGYLAVTGSAGPGISLKTEAIGWASMAEMPLIIVQRAARRPEHRLADQRRAERSASGDLRRSRRQPARRARGRDGGRLFLHRDRSGPHRAQIQHAGFHSERHIARHAHRGVRRTRSVEVDDRSETGPYAARRRFKPYPIDQITQHVPPGTRMLDGKYPLVAGLEHDEMGHPTGSPKLHMAMTAKRRNKLRKLAEEIPVPEVYGDQEGDMLLVGWGSTYGPIHDAVKLAREHGEKVGALHLRHIHPLPNGLEKIFAKFKRIVVVEMNDQGVYGFGQLATILRARYCEPKIESVTKTDGLTFRVKEILEGVFEGAPLPRDIFRAKAPHRSHRHLSRECEALERSRPAGSWLGSVLWLADETRPARSPCPHSSRSQFVSPSRVKAADLFEADFTSGIIYRFAPDGSRTVYTSGLNGPEGLAFDAAGNCFVSETGTGKHFTNLPPTAPTPFSPPASMARRVWSSTEQGTCFTPIFLAGSFTNSIQAVRERHFATGLNGPANLIFDSMGRLLEADFHTGNIFRFTPDGTQTTFASGVGNPHGLAFDANGDLFVADFDGRNDSAFHPGGHAEHVRVRIERTARFGLR